MTAWPIDWQQVVDEAVRRRKAEGLSQQMLATLVGISRPTIVSFERGETRLRMDKVFPILTELGCQRRFKADPSWCGSPV